MNTNPDYVYDWAVQQDPIQGYDLDRGTDGHGNQSPIEDSRMEGGTKVYTNPRIRFEFYTPAEKLKQVQRLKDDLGDIVGDTRLRDGKYQMDDDERRAAFEIEIDGVWYPANQLRALNTGIDRNGNQVWDGSKYVLGVDVPGHYGYTAAAEGGGDPVFTFTPEPIAS